ncbi:MAG: retropepsin-like aspartic protease [Candidatus Poribacteria bacterium]|nr:retropepsin-like aspartic protease [Candidatus Poribacteria bacterium]
MRNPDTGAAVSDVAMLLDSGADVTLIPQTAVEPLGIAAVSDKQYELMGFDGNRSFVSVAHLELVFCRRTFRGQFLLIDQTSGILGRNVLNAVSLLFDGPNLVWDERRPE